MVSAGVKNKFNSFRYFLLINIILILSIITAGTVFALCEDSDGGPNAFVNGFVQTNRYAGDPDIINRNDYCTVQESPVQPSNFCDSSGCGVIEFFCDTANSSSDYGVGQTYIRCQYGCRDGACLSSESNGTEPEEPPIITPPDVPVGTAGSLYIDFDAIGTSTKSGAAVVGNNGDYWNPVHPIEGKQYYENIPGYLDVTRSGLKFIDQTASSITVQMKNLAGGYTGTYALNDPMFAGYNYQYDWNRGNNGLDASLILHHIPEGTYDLYLYGPLGRYEVKVGTRSYGRKDNTQDEQLVASTSRWIQGIQYVVFNNIAVTNDGDINIKVIQSDDWLDDAIISGLQLVPAGTPRLYTEVYNSNNSNTNGTGDNTKLLNIDFGPYVRNPTKKTGPAAVGTCGDFWNTVFAGGGLDSYNANDLQYSDKTNSYIDGTFVNLAGSWGIVSNVWDWRAAGINPDTLDTMFNDYNYPWYNQGGESWVNLKNIPQGAYDVYIYGMSDTYDLIVDNLHYGEKTIPTNTQFFTELNWVEGHQYVKYSNVNISTSGEMSIHLLLGTNPWKDTNINGLQIVPAGTPLNLNSGVNKNACKDTGDTCRNDSDCPRIACVCASQGVVGCNCPVNVCQAGKCVTVTKKVDNAISCELSSTHEDRASSNGIFGPGTDITGQIANDFKWTCILKLEETDTIKSITIEHDLYLDAWSTSMRQYLGKPASPLVVTHNGEQLNARYEDTIGPLNPGEITFELFGQIQSVPFSGGKIAVEFVKSDELIANIPASSLGMERLDVSALSCADTDGTNFNTKGSLAYSSSDGATHLFEDYCYNNQKVTEGICGGTDSKQAMVVLGVCQYGCNNGICLTEDENASQIMPVQQNVIAVESTDGTNTANQLAVNPGIVASNNAALSNCNGCPSGDSCLSFGIRLTVGSDAKYCGLNKDLLTQKVEGETCDNDYECISNSCVNGKCTDLVAKLDKQQSQLDKIVAWLRDIFNFS